MVSFKYKAMIAMQNYSVCLILIWAPIRVLIFPSKIEFRSGSSMPVLTSCTSLYG